MQSAPASGLTTRALISTGVFAAIYFALLSINGLGVINPVMMLVGSVLTVILNAPVIMMFLSKVRAFGAFPILGFIIGALMATLGHVWYCVITATLFAFLADLVARAGNYRSRGLNVTAYGIFILWYPTPLLPIFYDNENYFAHVAAGLGQAHADQMRVLFQPWVIVVYAACMVVLALISAWVGSAIINKHFSRAGLA